MMRDTPVCFVSWIKEVSEERVRRLVSKVDTEGEVALVFPVTPAQFEEEVRKWYRASTNAQYLFITTHGALGRDGRVEGMSHAKDSDYFIGWPDLWNMVVKAKHKPPNIHIMGCRVTDAVHTWNQLITRRMNTPYFVGYNRVVDSPWQGRRIARALTTILGLLHVSVDTRRVTTLDEDFRQVLNLGTEVDAYIPYCLKGRKPHFASARGFEQTYGMTLRQYLDRLADQLEGRGDGG